MLTCRLQPKQDSIRLQIVHNYWNPVFTAVFYGHSVPDMYPCRTYTFATTHLLAETTQWKYQHTLQKMPYDWRDLCFDDSGWKSDVFSFKIDPKESLYLRHTVYVGKQMNDTIFYERFLILWKWIILLFD